MSHADLAGWTPVALNLSGATASIDWGDLSGVRFVEPFFHQTVERWAGANPAPLVRTGFDVLEVLADAPSLDPCALVFHASRCGSTLLSRLVGTAPGVLVVSEPGPLNTFLMSERAEPEAASLRELRLLVRALGRRRFGDEHHYVLKLSSWNVRRHALLRRAFPEAATIWLQRDPAATVASLLANPPGWQALRQSDRAQAIFGIAGADGGAEAFTVRVLAAMLAAASDIAEDALLLDYAELPEAAWSRSRPVPRHRLVARRCHTNAAGAALRCQNSRAPPVYRGRPGPPGAAARHQRSRCRDGHPPLSGARPAAEGQGLHRPGPPIRGKPVLPRRRGVRIDWRGLVQRNIPKAGVL